VASFIYQMCVSPLRVYLWHRLFIGCVLVHRITGVVGLCLYFTVSDHEKLNAFMDDGDERYFALMVLQAGFPIRCINIRRLTVVCSTWLQSTKGPCRFGTDPNTFACGCSIELDDLWLKHNWTISCYC